MSVDSEKICCTGCGFETLDVHRPIKVIYRLDGGKEIETWRSKGWCYKCNDYEDIEDMEPESLQRELVEKEQEKREACSRADKLAKRFLARFLYVVERRWLHDSIERFDKKIQDLGSLLYIATNRKSGPRCLRCWSDKTAPVTFDGDNLSHNFLHGCGGMLKIIRADILDNDVIRFNFAPTTYVLNEEGELLEEG